MGNTKKKKGTKEKKWGSHWFLLASFAIAVLAIKLPQLLLVLWRNSSCSSHHAPALIRMDGSNNGGGRNPAWPQEDIRTRKLLVPDDDDTNDTKERTLH
jgi:hypothetical protein